MQEHLVSSRNTETHPLPTQFSPVNARLPFPLGGKNKEQHCCSEDKVQTLEVVPRVQCSSCDIQALGLAQSSVY